MKKELTLVFFLFSVMTGCQSIDKNEVQDFKDDKLIYINKVNPNIRIIEQSKCITSSDLGATIIPSYSNRHVVKNFRIKSTEIIDTSEINKENWIEFNLEKNTWSSIDRSFTEKEFFKETYEKWAKEGKLSFSTLGLIEINRIDSTFLKNESKLARNIYCYSDNSDSNLNYFSFIFYRHGNLVLQTISKDFYQIDKIKLFDEENGTNYSYKQTVSFSNLNEFSILKTYLKFENNTSNAFELVVSTKYKITIEGEIIQLNNTEYEKIRITK